MASIVSLARSLAFWLFAGTVNTLYKLLYMLRLYVLLVEKDALAKTSKTAGDNTDSYRRIQNGGAWTEFFDAMKCVGEYALREADSNNVTIRHLDRIEGVRYLTRLIRGGLEAFMDNYDPLWPVLRPMPYNVKIGADNPDNLYSYATISGEHDYRITGTRGTVTYLSFGCYAGLRPGQGTMEPGHLDSSEILCDPEGNFEVIVSQRPQSVNWLKSESATTRLVVRQTFLDQGSETAAVLKVERITEGPPGPPPPLTSLQVVEGLSGAALFVSGAVFQFWRWSNMFAERPNRLITLDTETYMTAWADPAITLYHGYWCLGQQEALVIKVVPPACAYWNFQVNNWWMESLDSDRHKVHINKRTALARPDGSVVVVVSHLPEGKEHASLTHPCELSPVNWLSTAHHHHGTMALRWVLAKERVGPDCMKVPLTELHRHI